MPRPTHIAETVLYVDDLDRSVRFYTGLFKCPTLRRDERFCALRIAAGQVLLLFVRGASRTPVRVNGNDLVPAHDGSGPGHVCFGIHATDLASWEDLLRQQGIPIESTIRWPGSATSLYVRDPDHHALELATPGLWE